MSRNDDPLYIVDDELTVLESMTFMLESYGYQLEAFSSGEQFLAAVNMCQPGCVVLDSRMVGMSGQDVQRALQAAYSPLSIIYLTGHGDVPMAVAALKGGASDFLQKPVDGETLVRAIDHAMAVSQQRERDLYYQRILDELTHREREVLSFVVKGLKNQEIADVLCLSLRTIEVHRASIMKKLALSNVAHLIKAISHLL